MAAEAKALRNAKEVRSQIAQANRNKKKQDVTALVKVVVRLADKREFRLLVYSYSVFPPNIATPLIFAAPPPFGTKKYIIAYSNSTPSLFKTTLFDQENAQHEFK